MEFLAGYSKKFGQLPVAVHNTIRKVENTGNLGAHHSVLGKISTI
jgi:hypothetical protein